MRKMVMVSFWAPARFVKVLEEIKSDYNTVSWSRLMRMLVVCGCYKLKLADPEGGRGE